jgi:long-chain acyl-CoA synthetase
LRDPKVRTIGDLFRRNNEQFGQEIGVVFGGEQYTWGQINNRANRLANGLLKMGLQKSDRVAILNSINPIWTEVHGGVAKAGGILVPINYRLAPPELEKVFNDAEPNFLIMEEGLIPELLKGISRFSFLRKVILYHGTGDAFLDYDSMLSAASDQEPDSQFAVREDDIHAILYTSGTTGIPKGVMFLNSRTLDVVCGDPWPFELSYRTKRLIFYAPFTGGITFVLLNAIYGAAHIVFMEYDPVRVLETIEREKIETMGLVPTIMQSLIDASGGKRYDFSRLKRIRYGAMPISITLLRKAISFFGCEFAGALACTETTCMITQLDPTDHVLEGPPMKIKRLASVGRARPGVEVKIFDQEDRELPRGEVGEIVVTSMGLMAGYWNKPEETEKSMRSGWYHTGDMGFMDEEGYVFVADRKNDMIISGGFNIYPFEVESALCLHEDILETAVFGLADPTWGEMVVAVIRLKEGRNLSSKQVQDFCRRNLAGYKIPKEVKFVTDPLPRDSVGKILRREIKKTHNDKRR